MARVLSDETSLSGRRGRLRREAGLLRRLIPVEAVAAGVMLAVGAATRGVGWGVAACILAFLAVAHGAAVRQGGHESQSIKAGLRGETRVAQELARGLDNAHYVFNDLSVRSGFRAAQIDHLVVGPGGVFVIETKNWGGRITGGARDSAWTQEGEGTRPSRRHENPVLQNERHVRVLGACLRAAGIRDAPLFPVLVFAFRAARVEADAHDMVIASPASLPRLIAARGTPPRLAEAQIDAIIACLRRYA